MRILTWVIGSLSGLCGIMGLIVATDAVPGLENLPAPMTPTFWLLLAILLMLGCIVATKSSSGYE